MDEKFLSTLGQFDVVYSWGVLHHTGDMWTALANVDPLVSPGGSLYIAIYNDQGNRSRFWRRVKRAYCSGPIGKAAVCAVFVPYFFTRATISSLIKRRSSFRSYKKRRGMSISHDWLDWLGGYPYEAARPEQILRFYRQRGYHLVNMTTTNKHGCNQFVFTKSG